MKVEKGEELVLTQEEQKIFDLTKSQHPLGKNHDLYPIRINGRFFIVIDIGFGDFCKMMAYIEKLENEYNAKYWIMIKKYNDIIRARKQTSDTNRPENFSVLDLTESEIEEYYNDLNSLPTVQPNDEFTKYKVSNFVIYPDNIKSRIEDGSINFGITIALSQYIDEVSNINDFFVENSEIRTDQQE